ncbi:hypothetical protein PLCT2_00802 [Planctomycetaceae bacterium]|nr:hypothetical protein PLCT2_00802 [Planctomycetaceae bacterium]
MKSLTACLLLLLACTGLGAETLLAKFFPGKDEKKVAENWFGALPEYVVGQIKLNKFPGVYISNPADAKNPTKIEIFDVDKTGTKFRYYVMVRDGTDTNGRPVFKRGSKADWMEFTKLEPKFLANMYPVKGNPKDEDVAAFAAWLYSKKATSNPELKLFSDVANQVLSILATKPDLKPMIEEWIIEKEGWKAAPGELELFNAWDTLFQLERDMLVNKDLKDKLVGEREKAAKSEHADILKVRGNYDKRQRPPRKPLPSQQLVLIDWRIKEFRRTFGGSTFFKGKDVDSKLTEIQDSIQDDLDAIKDLKKQATEAKKDGKPDLEKRAQIMELASSLDPEDLALCAEVANAWIAWANIAPHGNTCDHNDGCKKAIPFFERILKYYPENTSFLLWLGKCYQAQGNGDAKKYYKRIIEICGKDKGDGKIAAALMDNMDKADAARGGK